MYMPIERYKTLRIKNDIRCTCCEVCCLKGMLVLCKGIIRIGIRVRIEVRRVIRIVGLRVRLRIRTRVGVRIRRRGIRDIREIRI